MRRLLCSFLLLWALAGCQTGADTDGALKSAAVEKSEKVTPVTNETVASVPSPAETAAEPAIVDAAPEKLGEEPEQKATTEPKQEVTVKSAKASADPIAEAAASIAKLRKTKGERTAVEAVLACYKKAQAASAPMASAQICAAQDFALSRNIIASRKPNATGSGDRALLISKRHGARIGALMQLKGMGQAQFNTFGKYLRQVAEPAFTQALKS